MKGLLNKFLNVRSRTALRSGADIPFLFAAPEVPYDSWSALVSFAVGASVVLYVYGDRSMELGPGSNGFFYCSSYGTKTLSSTTSTPCTQSGTVAAKDVVKPSGADGNFIKVVAGDDASLAAGWSLYSSGASGALQLGIGGIATLNVNATDAIAIGDPVTIAAAGQTDGKVTKATGGSGTYLNILGICVKAAAGTPRLVDIVWSPRYYKFP